MSIPARDLFATDAPHMGGPVGRPARGRGKFLAVLMALVPLLVVTACGPPDEPEGGGSDSQAELTAYFREFQPLNEAEESDLRTGDPVPSETVLPDASAPSQQQRYQCTTTPFRLTTNPDKIVTLNPDANKLWLGGLLQGKGYAGGVGSLRELPIRERAPLKVYIDLMGGDVTEEVENPDASSVQQAVSDLVQRAMAEETGRPARVSYQRTESRSAEQSLLELGFSAKYLGGEVSAKLESSRQANESSVLATFVQRLFTVSIVSPQTPAEFFSSDFTKADAQAQRDEDRMGPDNPPVVVSSISYGRVLFYNVTAKATSETLKAALEAAYNGGAFSGRADLTAEQQKTLDTATYRVAAIGGNEDVALNLIKEGQLGAYFSNPPRLDTAVPISYQVDNVGNNSAARFSEATDYNLTECAAVPNKAEDIGDIVKVENVRAYIERCGGAGQIFGQLNVNGHTFWDVPDFVSGDTPERTEFKLDNRPAPQGAELDRTVYSYPGAIGPWEFPYVADQPHPPGLHFRGNISDAQWIVVRVNPSVNTYDHTVTFPMDDSKYGPQEIVGNSQNCPIHLRFNLVKRNDIYKYTP